MPFSLLSLSLSLSLSLLLSLSLPPLLLSDPTTDSRVLCQSLSSSISVEFSSSVSCDVRCFQSLGLKTKCTIEQFVYQIRNHRDTTDGDTQEKSTYQDNSYQSISTPSSLSSLSTSILPLSSPSSLSPSPSPSPLVNTSHSQGEIKDFVLSPDEESISFIYLAPSAGSSEEIWVILSSSQLPIYNSPIDVTLVPPPSIPFWSFNNQLFVIIFVIVFCVFIGILIVILYSCVERRQRRKNQMKRDDVYARMYEEDLREDGEGEGEEGGESGVVNHNHRDEEQGQGGRERMNGNHSSHHITTHSSGNVMRNGNGNGIGQQGMVIGGTF